MSKIIDYVQAVRGELTHVSWPTRSQAIAYTALVIGISLGVSFILGAFDFIFTYLLERLILLTQ
ncbi:MAG TPA: preprotein translocase subunit SecE [Candidatus Paceibacterota bacterium]